MKLTGARVTNFKNINDSNLVDIGQSTCLVGKNEAGKSAFLKALECLKSTNGNYKSYNTVEDYPRRYYAEYKERHGGEEAVVLVTHWRMDDDDIAALEAIFGAGTVNNRNFVVSKAYETTGSTWSVDINERKVIENHIDAVGMSADERAPLKNLSTTDALCKVLTGLESLSPNQQNILKTFSAFRENRAILRAVDILDGRMPSFMYFSHYDRMSGQISINKLANDKAQNITLTEGDKVFLDFLEYAGTSVEELNQSKKFEELNAKCEAAANRITDQIFEYWTQNDELEIRVVLSEGRTEDPPPFNAGPVARARVINNLHRASVPFSERSAGFIWFFSFLVKFAQLRRHRGNVIILLDEPGLTLHGTAQKDLLRYFEEQLEPNHQIIFSTHSPFMVPPHRLNTVRTVEDVVKRDGRDRKISEGTKIRSDVLTTDPQTNFPIFGAMGFEVTQTLVIGTDTLLVEGPGDILFLQAVSSVLKKKRRAHLDPRWAICPSGGIDKILPFVRLFYGNKLNVAVLTDFDRGQKRKLEDLYKSDLLENDRIILATELAGKEEADIEDLFEIETYVDLINKTYSLTRPNVLTAQKLLDADAGTVRNVKKAEAYFRLLPDKYPDYSHYDPALYLLQHPEILEDGSEAASRTLDRFEGFFAKIGAYLKG